MNSKISLAYSWFLILSGVYYAALLALAFAEPLEAWKSWAGPSYAASSYWFLAITYLLAIGTPLLMIGSGAMLLRKQRISMAFALPLSVFLLLADIIGKLALLIGVLLYAFSRGRRFVRT